MDLVGEENGTSMETRNEKNRGKRSE